jgi:hypothetical protein
MVGLGFNSPSSSPKTEILFSNFQNLSWTPVTVVGQRLKQSGMFWGLPGAHNILDIRCVLENGQFDAFWNRLLPNSHPHAKAA